MNRQGFVARAVLVLSDLSAWVHQQWPLRAIYLSLPKWLRGRASARLAKAVSMASRFGPLPPPEAVASNLVVSRPVADPNRGVNIYGYLRGQFGLGESARTYSRALIDAGYPVALNDIDLDLPHGLQEDSLNPYIGNDAPYPINLIFVNPDYLCQALATIRQGHLEGRYMIACWFWELERIPDEWQWAARAVDEIMVASSFVEKAFRSMTDKPILRVPLPIHDEVDSGLSREDFGLSNDKFVFLTTFDFHSSVHRKNPFAVIEAFRKAFPVGRDDVRLMIKSSNGNQYSDQLCHLLSVSLEDPRIIVRDQLLDRRHARSLQRCADAYVSLHRAEGFGLGLAECMAMGKPVIATGWSGNMEFTTPRNSHLVDYRLVPVGEGEYLHQEGALWAEPDIDHAATLMRALSDDPSLARESGKRAADYVRDHLSPTVAAATMINRFDEIASSRDIASSADLRAH